jgi:hypothetical protein
MRIGIEINGVLRNTLGKLEQVYKKYLIDKTEGIEYEDDFTEEELRLVRIKFMSELGN